VDSLLDAINKQIADEKNGTTEYSNLIDKVESSDLDEDTKKIFINVLSNIRDDEAKHNSLLELMSYIIS
jgi:rubrerythrin